MTEQTYPVIRQGWLEIEPGWGYRPDDDSLHLTMEDREAFIAEWFKKHPRQVSGDYTSPDLEPKVVQVNELTYLALKHQREGMWENTLSRYGIWLFKHARFEPADWFCKRMREQGFRVEDFGKATPAVVDAEKNQHYQSKAFNQGMARALFGE